MRQAVFRALLVGCALPMAVFADDERAAVDLLPADYRPAVSKQLLRAGSNRAQLEAAVRRVRPERREALAFLLAHMPPADLRSLDADFLLENVRWACRARGEVPWRQAVPDELFLNCVLPYANVSERRDRWRMDFYRRFISIARECSSPGEAAVRLNREVFPALKVRYHPTKRIKPDQSPNESIHLGYASCTGMSILLVDACRAVCVPARLAGIPDWGDREGNHTWTEVWDRQWHFMGSGEPAELDHAWFTGRAARADPTTPRNSIYAVSFRRTSTHFPLAWNAGLDDVWAENVTCFYTCRRQVTLHLQGPRDLAGVSKEVVVRRGCQMVARDVVEDTARFVLAGDTPYRLTVRLSDRSREWRTEIRCTDADSQVFEVRLGDERP